MKIARQKGIDSFLSEAYLDEKSDEYYIKKKYSKFFENQIKIPEFSPEELERLKNVVWSKSPSTFTRRGKLKYLGFNLRYLLHTIKCYFVKIFRLFFIFPGIISRKIF